MRCDDSASSDMAKKASASIIMASTNADYGTMPDQRVAPLGYREYKTRVDFNRTMVVLSMAHRIPRCLLSPRQSAIAPTKKLPVVCAVMRGRALVQNHRKANAGDSQPV